MKRIIMVMFAITAFGLCSLANAEPAQNVLPFGPIGIAAANTETNTVKIFRSSGNGLFTAIFELPTSGKPSDLAVGDLNNDHVPDIVVANEDTASLSVFIGYKGNWFDRVSDTPILNGDQPRSLALGDVDRDGFLDAIIATSGYRFYVMLGDGKGGFGKESYVDIGAAAQDIIVADLNDDKVLDVLVGTIRTRYKTHTNEAKGLLVFWGTGDGGFKPPLQLGDDTPIVAVATADLNKDSNMDIIASDYENNQIIVFLGIGNGRFKQNGAYATGDGPYSIAMADFNNDKKMDAVVPNVNKTNISVLLGDGKGGFETDVKFDVIAEPRAIEVADLNGDHFPDIVAGTIKTYTEGTLSGYVTLLFGNGKGQFDKPENYRVDSVVERIAIIRY